MEEVRIRGNIDFIPKRNRGNALEIHDGSEKKTEQKENRTEIKKPATEEEVEHSLHHAPAVSKK